MDLFTYLMAKNGNNTSVHGDLFSYLLGKGQSQTQTISGVTIYIPDAKKLVSFTMTKESTQATSILPSGYTQVDYIKSSKTQYLLLNYNAKATSSYELSLKFDNINNDWTNSYKGFISGRDFETIDSQYFQINFGSNNSEKQTLFVWINSGQATSVTRKEVGNAIENKNSLIINNGQMTYGSFSSTTPIATGVNSQTNFLLFAGRTSTSGNTPVIFDAYDMYVYDFKIYESNVLVKHYIPCYRNSDNEVGLYEIINGEFFANQGTGAFTYGSIAQLPNPDYPIEVKTVKGYRNLFDKNSFNSFTSSLQQLQLILKPNTTYTMSSNILYDTPSLANLFIHNSTTSPSATTNGIYDGKTVNVTTNSDGILIIEYRNNHGSLNNYNPIEDFWYFLIEGTEKLPYVPYGNNYIAVNISDGTNTNNYPIPLNNNEIVGIGNYKDELKVDKSGHVFINKKTGKKVFDGSEAWIVASASAWGNNSYAVTKTSINMNTPAWSELKCNYYKWSSKNYSETLNNEILVGTSALIINNNNISTVENFKTWLSTHNTDVYYVLAQENLIDLQTTVDLSLFKGVNNVSNSEDGYMTIEYH